MTVSSELPRRATIPQIRVKIELIHSIATDEFWKTADLLTFEQVRTELRGLIKFIVDEGGPRTVYTNLASIGIHHLDCIVVLCTEN